MVFRMKGPFFFKKHKHKESDHDFTHEGGYEIKREKLEEGVVGEAENGGVIKIDISVEEGSDKEKEVIAHEETHLNEMGAKDENGDPLLAYDEDSVTDNIADKEYKREDGFLIDKETGLKYKEGDKRLPHEKRAWRAGEQAKNKNKSKTI